MNLYRLLRQRQEANAPIRVGLIGAGKFGSMFLAQARHTPGLHLMALCDLIPDRAQVALRQAGWPSEQCAAASFADARSRAATHITDDAEALICAAGIDVVVEATGDPAAGIRHALACCEQGRHVIMVTVEADVLAGPLLAQRARQAGIVYSLAYGDQPALITELVDWARASGFAVVCAGKGTKYMPEYHTSTPDAVWTHYGLTQDEARQGGMNPKMFNSFLDGTKSAIEMAVVANATGLLPQPDGLQFPPCGTDALAQVLKPRNHGGVLNHKGTVEVVSSLNRDGSAVHNDLRWGVYVTFEATSDYVSRCFTEYGLVTDTTGRYTALYRPSHLIGLELGISIASVALRGEPTGMPRQFVGDVVTVAKRDLAAGAILDGEGGYMVWGQLMPARDSIAAGALPIGLAHDLKLTRSVAAGSTLKWDDVAMNSADPTLRFRQEMERLMSAGSDRGFSSPPSQ